MKLTTRAASAMIALMFMPISALAAGAEKVVPVLFETRQLDLIDKDKGVTYRFERKGSDERLVGANYQDDIHLNVAKVNDKGERDVVFKVFSGANARDPQSWPELTINPIFIWFLDRSVGTFNALAGGNQMYLKGKFRDALRDKALLEEVKVDYQGKQIDAYKVTVAPYADDPNAGKMQGFENATFTITVSKDVPGYFLDLQASFVSKEAAGPKLEEHIKLVSLGEVK